MSRKGNCTLKNELVHHLTFDTRAEARSAIFEYIETFYNARRLHQSLGYQSPDEYEKEMMKSDP